MQFDAAPEFIKENDAALASQIVSKDSVMRLW
jgi:hypothetical protein